MSKSPSNGARQPAPNMATVYPHDIRWENRHSEHTHSEILRASWIAHERVREQAELTLSNAAARDELQTIMQLRFQEEERLRLATIKAREEIRIRELENAARQIPKPPPRLPTPAPQTPAPVQQQSPTPIPTPTPQTTQAAVQPAAPAPAPVLLQPQSPTPQVPVFAPRPQQQAQSNNSDPFAQRAAPPPVHQPQPAKPQVAHIPRPATKPYSPLNHLSPRYVEIHKSCKALRKYVLDYHPDLKKKAGQSRRILQRSIGQLTDVKGANTPMSHTIVGILREALNIPGPNVDPSLFMIAKANPNAEGSIHNGPTMPALFIYLLIMFSKFCIGQFIGESARNPKSADPIGVIAVSIFARDEFKWRNMSFIDIMIAKFRVNCPVLFGVRGNEHTEEGRARLGWRKDINGNWISEQDHNDRMVGLGAGFAAISLRDFSKSQMTNPWPAHNYWQAMARIVCTPSEETSPTQYIVLKSMIDNYERKIIHLFGTMGKVALRTALVDFPSNALEHNSAVSGLEVLADKLARDDGLQLRY